MRRPTFNMPLVLLVALLGSAAGGAMPRMPKGMGVPSGMGRGGPPWRKAIDKVFTEACQLNKGAPSVFCFPNIDELIAGLQAEQYGIDLKGEMFLMDVYVVVKQLMDWPPAWSMVAKVLAPEHAWTAAFCDKIVGGAPWWHEAIPMVRKGFILLRQTMVELEKDLPPVANAISKWMEELRIGGNTQTQKLLKEFQNSDKLDAKNRTVHPRPFIRLMQQVHAKAVQHLFGTACKDSESAMGKLLEKDARNMTALHHAASLGDAAVAKAILKVVPKAKREEFTNARDNLGYSALDWARLGSFDELVKEFGKKKGVAADAAPIEPLAFFPEGGDEAAATAEGSGQCRWDGTASTCTEASDSGGWQPPTQAGVPAEWLPPVGEACFADTIDVTKFHFETFAEHYMLHPRPLLIRGAAVSGSRAANYTREGLLGVAGAVKVEAERYPEAKQYDASTPMAKTLQEYVAYLDDRSEDVRSKKLHFVFENLGPQAYELNFTHVLPDILVDKVEHKGTRFFLGGVLMGTPPRHELPTAQSLVFGRQLWFLEPPGREVIAKEEVYKYLQRTGGAPEASRCIQEAGDVLFVPRGWSGGAICLGDCVGTAHYISHKTFDLRD